MHPVDWKALKKTFNQNVFKMLKDNTVEKLYQNCELEKSIKILFNQIKNSRRPNTDNLAYKDN